MSDANYETFLAEVPLNDLCQELKRRSEAGVVLLTIGSRIAIKSWGSPYTCIGLCETGKRAVLSNCEVRPLEAGEDWEVSK